MSMACLYVTTACARDVAIDNARDAHAAVTSTIIKLHHG